MTSLIILFVVFPAGNSGLLENKAGNDWEYFGMMMA